MRNINVIPFVCSAGGQVMGSERGAVDLKQSGLIEALADEGISIKWQEDPAKLYDGEFGKMAHENLAPLGTEERKELVLWHCKHLQEQVVEAIGERSIALTIGGDHAMALGSISGVAKAKNAYGKTGVIWVDAHPDFNTPDTSPSQALHGMPLAALSGRGDVDYVALAGDQAVLDPQHIVYVGIRDIDPGERDFIERLGMHAFTMEDINRLGVAEVLKQAGELVSKGTDAQVISIDLDGFDPVDVPSVGSPVSGGLRAVEALPALKAMMRDVGFDLIEITEYNPTLAGRDQTYSFVENLFRALLPVKEAVEAA